MIESERAIDGHTIVGCGMGVFVSRAFADAEIATPRPGLNDRIVDAVATGRPVLLDRDGIGAGNAGSGLDFVNLYGTLAEGDGRGPQKRHRVVAYVRSHPEELRPYAVDGKAR